MSEVKTILRFEKLKSYQKLRSVNAHNQRFHKVPNANPELKNVHLYGSKNLAKDVRTELNQRGIKPRKGAVLALEAIISLSPKYFSDDKKTKDFTYAAVRFLKENFDENVISITLHVDETSPHIHAIILPIKDNGRLSARDYMSPSRKEELQEIYCNRMSELLNTKFTYTKKSKATHTDLKTYYGMVNEKLKPFKEENQSLKKDVSKLQEKLFKEQEENLELSGKVESLEKTIKTQQEEISYLKKLVKRLENVVKKLKSRFSNKNKKSSDPYELPELTIQNNPDIPKELQKNKRRNRPSI
ncbi:plasmid recombination protein [Vibrio sp. B511a]|uniref:MobV family relaxase n=1 Tax=Vibrio sp. B511a TaxID=2835905 RepID=UPI0025558DB3|nr:MobV family relaxase [Vibrio sp. B511a]MDK9734461.1 plasmid recombination protein [Vibrio sp. B511a]